MRGRPIGLEDVLVAGLLFFGAFAISTILSPYRPRARVYWIGLIARQLQAETWTEEV